MNDEARNQLKAHTSNLGNASTLDDLVQGTQSVEAILKNSGHHQLLHRMHDDVIRLAHLENSGLIKIFVNWTKEKWQEELRAL